MSSSSREYLMNTETEYGWNAGDVENAMKMSFREGLGEAWMIVHNMRLDYPDNTDVIDAALKKIAEKL